MEEKFGSDLANMKFDFLSEEPTCCIFCDQTISINFDAQPMLKHLLEEHKFVIGSPEEVADFKHYITYWRKLRNENLEDYCVVYITNTEPDAKLPSEKFYLLCDKLSEDKNIRATLKQMKLDFITHQKEIEVQDKDYLRKCIYCQEVIGGGVANSFHHLTFDHGFSLGNPDNIVFGAKLLEIMNDMLQRLQCLHCEKTFKNYGALREHMRKKQHRSLNPKNKLYDSFYLLNYLKPGTPWEEAKRKMLEEKEPSVGRSEVQARESEDAVEEEHLWTDWREETGGIPATCLFCPFTTTKVPSILFPHMEDCHNFRFEELTQGLNFYVKVKLVNFIRTQVRLLNCISCESSFPSQESLLEHLGSCSNSRFPERHQWDNSSFLIPVIENDGLLIHLDDDDIEDGDSSSVASSLNEEVVLPEDALSLPSILNDWKLREELSQDVDVHNPSKGGLLKTSIFKCLFCSFSLGGETGRTSCIEHMNSLHNFSYKWNLEKGDTLRRMKLINYIRHSTEVGKCYVCGKTYLTRGALDEHRILQNHTNLPPSQFYKEEKWMNSILQNDGFLEELS